MDEVLESIIVNQERDDKKMEENTQNNGSNTLLCRGFFYLVVCLCRYIHVCTYIHIENREQLKF